MCPSGLKFTTKIPHLSLKFHIWGSECPSLSIPDAPCMACMEYLPTKKKKQIDPVF
jgi:hypothetical protein